VDLPVVLGDNWSYKQGDYTTAIQKNAALLSGNRKAAKGYITF